MTVKSNAAKTQPANELTIIRVFDAPRDLVFKMWSEGEHMKHWNCPSGFTMLSAHADFRPGGAVRADMRSPDGEVSRERGVYKEIVPNERIVMTHAWLDESDQPGHETIITVTFEDEGGKTRMNFHQTDFDTKASRDGHEAGWNECFDKLAAHMAAI